MSLFNWTTRCSGGLALIILFYTSFSVLRTAVYRSAHSDYLSNVLVSSFAYYGLFLHILLIVVTTRSSWGLIDILLRIRKSVHSIPIRPISTPVRRDSIASVHGDETLTNIPIITHGLPICTSDASDSGGDVPAPIVIQAIVIPNYNEDIATLRETLNVLASHANARRYYDVYLAMEQRERNASTKALTLIQEFVKKFRGLAYTLHPADLPGEAVGKGSNNAWAALILSYNYPLTIRRNVIVTILDADSHVLSNYFSMMHEMHVAHPQTAHTTLYVAPIIFDRNAHMVPAIVRMTDIMWAATGISGLYCGSSIAPPTSVYSVPLELIDLVGGWDADAEGIGEDFHMYLKCFFALKGNLTCQSILAPVSQTNVSSYSGLQGASGTLMDMKARYKQALRHMWGSLDIGYTTRMCVDLWFDRKQSSRAFRPLHASSGMDNSLVQDYNQYSGSKYCRVGPGDDEFGDDLIDPDVDINRLRGKISPDRDPSSGVTYTAPLKPHWARVLMVFHRIFEAYFLAVHMTTFVIISTFYLWLRENQVDPLNLNRIFAVCEFLRVLAIVQGAVYLCVYDVYHKTCLDLRESEMKAAGLADGIYFSGRSTSQRFFDYVMLPLLGPIYCAAPCIQAQVYHFWSKDLVYTVSRKLTRQSGKRTAKTTN